MPVKGGQFSFFGVISSLWFLRKAQCIDEKGDL